MTKNAYVKIRKKNKIKYISPNYDDKKYYFLIPIWYVGDLLVWFKIFWAGKWSLPSFDNPNRVRHEESEDSGLWSCQHVSTWNCRNFVYIIRLAFPLFNTSKIVLSDALKDLSRWHCVGCERCVLCLVVP